MNIQEFMRNKREQARVEEVLNDVLDHLDKKAGINEDGGSNEALVLYNKLEQVLGELGLNRWRS